MSSFVITFVIIMIIVGLAEYSTYTFRRDLQIGQHVGVAFTGEITLNRTIINIYSDGRVVVMDPKNEMMVAVDREKIYLPSKYAAVDESYDAEPKHPML